MRSCILKNLGTLLSKPIDDLLEAISLQAEILELKASSAGPAMGTVIESSLDKGRGPTATVLVQSGTLNKKDYVLVGKEFGRIRAMYDEFNKEIVSAGPGCPVVITGLSGTPNVADQLIATNDEKKVVISRILERGVGAFFKINDKDARAKDVSIMFYDSGSGARSSSIISQGNIDQIINFKPIDRKIILEDAAGTSGLQARRHESELKLQSTESNLEKIDLNLNNLYENQKSLSRQKAL